MQVFFKTNKWSIINIIEVKRFNTEKMFIMNGCLIKKSANNL